MSNVIIIGSGLGGLTAGNLLAQKGHDVTMFESHNLPGGYTAGFHRNGFYFESGTLSFEASASVFKAMKNLGVYDRIEFVQQKIHWASEDFDKTPESYDESKKMIYSAYPQEKQKLNGYFAEIDNMVDAMGTIDKPIPYFYSGIPYIMSILSYIPGGVKMAGMMKKYGNITTSELADMFFEKGSKLYKMFTSIGYPDMAAFLMAGLLSGIYSDFWTVKGGMQSWADVLAESFEKLGGKLLLGSRVDGIITKDGVVKGISCKGTDFNADYVIAACDYKKAILELLDDKNLIPGEMQKKINDAPVSEAMFTVYLGLNMPNKELEKRMVVPHVNYLDLNSDNDIYDSDDERFFEKASLTLYSPSLVNPDHAPRGKSSLMLQTMVPYRWMQNWGGGHREIYKQLKQKAMETMIDKAAKVVPELKSVTEYKDAATPLTYERFTNNTDGASSSFSWNPQKSFYKNTMGVKVDTPVKNLFIGSSWAMQIGGVPGALAAAYQCAHRVK